MIVNYLRDYIYEFIVKFIVKFIKRKRPMLFEASDVFRLNKAKRGKKGVNTEGPI